MAIKIFEKDVRIPTIERRKLKSKLKELVCQNKLEVGEINYIFVNDDELLRINLEFLNHDYYTDVITFDYSSEEKIEGEIYLSIERIRENSVDLGISIDSEIYRVAAHGMLHLLGFKDGSSEEKREMRQQEDEFLKDW